MLWKLFDGCFSSHASLIFLSHGRNGQNFHFTELIFNCIWQLSFGNSYNRSRFREAGAENFLWRITNSPNSTPAQRSRGQAVLGWLKSQVKIFLLLFLTSLVGRRSKELTGGNREPSRSNWF